jgi:hypothetical protein
MSGIRSASASRLTCLCWCSPLVVINLRQQISQKNNSWVCSSWLPSSIHSIAVAHKSYFYLDLVFPLTVFTSSREHGDLTPDGSMQVWQPSSHVQTKFGFYLIPPPSRMGKQRSLLVSCHLLTGILHCLLTTRRHRRYQLGTALALETCAGPPSFRVKQDIFVRPVFTLSLQHCRFPCEQPLLDKVRAVSMAVSNKSSTDSVSRCMHSAHLPPEQWSSGILMPTASVNRLLIGRDEEVIYKPQGSAPGGWT